MIAAIGERVDVAATFTAAHGLNPKAFIWAGRRYSITRITASWSESAGAHRVYRYAAITDGANIYELAFFSDKLIWLLDRIHTDG